MHGLCQRTSRAVSICYSTVRDIHMAGKNSDLTGLPRDASL